MLNVIFCEASPRAVGLAGKYLDKNGGRKGVGKRRGNREKMKKAAEGRRERRGRRVGGRDRRGEVGRRGVRWKCERGKKGSTN